MPANTYLPAAYNPTWNYSGIGQQMYPAYQPQSVMAQPVQPNTQTQQSGHGLIWVDGEVGAKAYQMPPGWPCNQPIALWDTNDTVIYLKSTNPMGMPNPLQKAHYRLEEYRNASVSVPAPEQPSMPDMSEYVRKDDMERMKQELMESISSVNASGESGPSRRVRGE